MTTGLTAALIARRDIEVPGGGKFAVRGLSLDDIMQLYRRHTGEMALWFERLNSGEAEISLEAVPQIASGLLATAPVIAAEIIAASCGGLNDEEAVSVAGQLPVASQAAALEAIADLTFTQEMPPKKLLETVARAARSLSGPETTTT